MLNLQIHDRDLEGKLKELLERKFNGDSDEMLREFIRIYSSQLNRSKYSGILKWDKDGLAYQKEVRSEPIF